MNKIKKLHRYVHGLTKDEKPFFVFGFFPFRDRWNWENCKRGSIRYDWWQIWGWHLETFFRKDPTGNDRLRNMKKKILHLRYSFRHTLSYIIYSNLKNFLDRKYGLMNYAIEYCPVCKKREVVYTTGQTKCSNCSTLITPCDACLNCTDICPYKSGEIHNSPSILECQIIHFI